LFPKVDARKHLIILGGDMLEDLLTEQDDLSPKETIKEYKTHLKMTNNKIRKCNMQIPHKTTGVLIRVPGLVFSEEQQLIAKLTWEIKSCNEQISQAAKGNKDNKRNG
jgi:hypothetical protein